MDPTQEVLVAYKQNGQFLHPDHGFPCRMIIPGWIGGRQIKWLSHISVSDSHSENWYHEHDNKVCIVSVCTAVPAILHMLPARLRGNRCYLPFCILRLVAYKMLSQTMHC